MILLLLTCKTKKTALRESSLKYFNCKFSEKSTKLFITAIPEPEQLQYHWLRHSY